MDQNIPFYKLKRNYQKVKGRNISNFVIKKKVLTLLLVKLVIC